MWKLLVGFVLFAALALYVLTRSGAHIDMGGEKHEIEVPAASAPASAASVP
jgi:hypothetical protein